MNRKNIGRLLSIFLCAAMLFGMLPSAAAAGISSVEISGIGVPAAGGQVSANAAVADGCGYSVSNVSWIGWRSSQSESSAAAVAAGSTFGEGMYYQVQITLAAAEGNEFSSGLSATVNGSFQNVEVAVSSTASATVKRTFFIPEPAIDTIISNVSVTGLTVPTEGQSPDFTAAVSDATYAVSQVIWYNADSPATLSQSDKFAAGVRYQVQIILEAGSNHSFASSVSGLLNGSTVSCGSVSGMDSTRYVGIIQEYTVAGDQITQVEVTGLTVPVKGGQPDQSVVVAAGADYVVDSVSWKKWIADSTSASAVSVHSLETFRSGYCYRVDIVLQAKTGYTFAGNNGAPAVSGSIDGAAAQVTTATGKDPGRYVTLSMEYSLDVKLIESVSVSDIIPPFAGERPSNRYRISPQADYTVVSVYWEMWDGTTPTEEYTKMNAYTIFASGIFYRVNVVLQAKEGTEFATDDRGQSQVTATINEETGIPAKDHAGKDAAQYICVSFDYPALTENIQHVDVLKIDEPAEGNAPDIYAEVPEEAMYSVDKITWERLDTTQKPADYVKMSTYETFQNGQEYRVVIRLRARSGGAFFVNQFDELQVTATVNGNPTIPAEPVDRLDPMEYVAISYAFSLSTDTKVIRQVNLHDLQVPRLDETPDYDVNTDAVAKYSVHEVIWERLEGRRSSTVVETLTQESTFREGQYYRVRIILKAGEDTEFYTDAAGRPQVTAVLNNGNGMAAERAVGKEPEEFICVSYVYGIFSVIDGGGSQWSPEKDDLKFRFTGDFENFSGLRVDGVLLDRQFYTATSGSTVILLSKAYLNTLQDGIYELTVLYTDGQVTTQFQVQGGNYPDGSRHFRLNPWFFLLPLALTILVILFGAVFIIRKRAESRVYKEEYEEYYEDDEDEEE